MSLSTDVIDPRTRVIELLNALGNDADEVYETLRRLGVTGERGEPCGCPIFYYLRDAGIPVERVSAGHVKLFFDFEVIFLPDPVEDFIEGFDVDDAYPALVEPEAVNR